MDIGHRKLNIGNSLVIRFIIFLIILLPSCSDEDNSLDYAEGNPSILASNWIVFQFTGGGTDGQLSSPYEISTAIDPNNNDKLILDNVYNTGVRARVEVISDTAIIANKTDQLELINMGEYGIEKVSIDGYINRVNQYNYALANFLYRLASISFENMSFNESDISEIIMFRAGLYDQFDAPVDSVLIMGYRKIGFEDVDSNN